MTRVYCFSGSGHSLAVAKAFCEKTVCSIVEIGGETEMPTQDDTAVVVFPVYCQNIPVPVKGFLKKLAAKYIVLIATYGKISYGNVLYEAQALVQGQVIAGAYIPTGHTFLPSDDSFCKAPLQAIAERIQAPQKICIPKSRKNPLADLFPALRSRIGVRIQKLQSCNNCGLCEKSCPTDAIRNGKIHSQCIRCLRCVTNCPQKALRFQNTYILNQYLKKYYHKEEYLLYL